MMQTAGTQTPGVLAPNDAKIASHDTLLNAATSSGTANAIVKRDSLGSASFLQITVLEPTVSNQAATKNYVDTGLAAIPKMYVQTATPTGTIPEGSLWFKG